MYVAIQSFKTTNGITYRMGDIIETDEYDVLSLKDKAKFKKKEERKKVSEYDA